MKKESWLQFSLLWYFKSRILDVIYQYTLIIHCVVKSSFHLLHHHAPQSIKVSLLLLVFVYFE